MAERLDLLKASRRLDADGFAHLEQLCDRESVERLFSVALTRGGEVRAALGEREIGIGSAAGYREIVQRSPGRWDVPITPAEFGVGERDLPWWPLIATVLGDDAEYSFSGVVFSEPGSQAQCWHMDSPHVAAEHRPAHALNVLMALHDIPLAMGPTELARGSHVMTNHLANPRLVREELIYQHPQTSPASLVENTDQREPDPYSRALSAGSCLVFDDRLLHRGLANRSESTRHVAYFSYRAKGYAENTHFESNRSVFA